MFSFIFYSKHENHKGNIIWDKMAKAGVNMNIEGQEPRIPISKCAIKQKLKEWKKEENDYFSRFFGEKPKNLVIYSTCVKHPSRGGNLKRILDKKNLWKERVKKIIKSQKGVR